MNFTGLVVRKKDPVKFDTFANGKFGRFQVRMIRILGLEGI